MIVSDDRFDLLRSVLAETQWLTRVRTNVDEARQRIIDAAQALVESGEPDKSGDPVAVRESGPAPLAEFHVMGTPAPQGSKTYMPKQRVMVESGRKRLVPWRDAVASEASRAISGADGPHDGPLRLEATFRLAMPRSRPKRIQALQEYPSVVKPDLDKVVRATLDALKMGGLIRDDSLVCELVVRKIEVVGWTGAHIKLFAIPT